MPDFDSYRSRLRREPNKSLPHIGRRASLFVPSLLLHTRTCVCALLALQGWESRVCPTQAPLGPGIAVGPPLSKRGKPTTHRAACFVIRAVVVTSHADLRLCAVSFAGMGISRLPHPSSAWIGNGGRTAALIPSKAYHTSGGVLRYSCRRCYFTRGLASVRC